MGDRDGAPGGKRTFYGVQDGGLNQGDNFHLVSGQETLGQDRKLHHSFYEKNSRKKLFRER